VKIFLDANVLFTAAHRPEGKSSFIIDLGSAGHWSVVTCRLALEEADKNLLLKFPHCRSQLDKLSKNIELLPTVLEGVCPVDLPEKDRPILLSAIDAHCSHLLTGDLKHFGKYMNNPQKTGGVCILTASDFLGHLQA
jgi:predicted nucleic acid-binding protein